MSAPDDEPTCVVRSHVLRRVPRSGTQLGLAARLTRGLPAGTIAAVCRAQLLSPSLYGSAVGRGHFAWLAGSSIWSMHVANALVSLQDPARREVLFKAYGLKVRTDDLTWLRRLWDDNMSVEPAYFLTVRALRGME